ncbi:MAG: SDR family oxidoreductase [Planctomycetota bacterium]|jgi:NAD(P)-dependent dehydrogenase (short-subunit alcohol dehydrogenase family)
MKDQPARVGLVTGGASGLGKAVAMELARRGWSLCIQHGGLADVAADAVRDMLDAAEEAGQKIEAEAFAADLASAPQREQLVESAIERFEQIDMLVNASAARPGRPTDLLEVTEDDFSEAIDASVTGALFLTQLVANEMVRLVEAGLIENPKIVTINSISAYASSVDHGPQCISRAALSMVSKLFADRLGEHGINVYEICVGMITAGPGDPAHEQYDKLIEQGLTPIRRWGRPGDVARVVAAIADDLLTFTTGETINVDGGFHLRRL